MKRMVNKILLSLTLLTFLFIGLNVMADPPDPPPMPGQHGETTDQGPGTPVGTPIDGGLTIFLVLGAVMGGKKVYSVLKNEE